MTTLREQTLDQLQRFINEHLLAYEQQRQIDRGAGRHHAVSGLSAAIRHRLILEEEVLSAVLARYPYEQIEKFVQEVCWRTYWKGWLQTNPQAWSNYLQSRNALAREFSSSTAASRSFSQALNARTGIKCFDAWAEELVSTGYLHNHARMWFASIWIFTLKLPWQLGADFFMRHLLDADPASNTLSWRWVAGLHTSGKHYLARAENILRNTEGRHDPRGQLDEHAAALSEAGFEPRRQPWRAPNQGGLAPIGASAGLLLTEEDLQVAELVGRYSPRVVIAVREPVARSVRSLGAAAANYARRALAEAANSASTSLECPLVVVDSLNARAAIATACVEYGVDDLVTAYVPVGPARDSIDQLAAMLAGQQITVQQLLRRWDLRAWPHCSRGFFQFREHIPGLLENLANARSAILVESGSQKVDLAVSPD